MLLLYTKGRYIQESQPRIPDSTKHCGLPNKELHSLPGRGGQKSPQNQKPKQNKPPANICRLLSLIPLLLELQLISPGETKVIYRLPTTHFPPGLQTPCSVRKKTGMQVSIYAIGNTCPDTFKRITANGEKSVLGKE